MIDQLDIEVPEEESPEVCHYCDRPFSNETYRVLHEGVGHFDQLDDAARRSFAEAYEAEQEAIRLFRLKALGALVAIYFGFLWAFSILG